MPPFHPFAALSRATRASSLPKTPEPLADAQTTSPPRPRLRLKRRNASQLHAPTQQFLASVAAADVPIPSIEGPYVYDEDMLDTLQQATNERIFSPPKTPAPDFVPSVSPRRYPNWSMASSTGSLESSPEYESSRPSTARSTQTSASLFSHFSTVDDPSQCLSPEWEHSEPFTDDAGECAGKSSKTVSKSRKAPWTKAMNQHLWSTYLLYLQDPHVTPFRVGKCGIPPHGVCARVAREAKRSWKGCNSQPKSGRHLEVQGVPAAREPSSYVQWPHTCAATRAHLREMCKANAGSTVRSNQYLTHSPTPFGKAASRLRNRRFGPAISPSAFSSSDMAISLAVSTSDSMQAQGPLAQLTRSQPEPALAQAFPLSNQAGPATAHLAPGLQRPRLGSPFMVQSYGPSSSTSLAASLELSSETHRQAQTMGHQRGLQSPARVTRSRSNTQKRRDRQPLFEPRRIKRPSIGSDLWADPAAADDRTDIPSSAVEFSSTASKQCDNLFVPRANVQELFEATQTPTKREGSARRNLSIALEGPPRLGSPFAFAGNSRSVPNRFSSPAALAQDGAWRPFATVQQPSESGVTTPKASLASRLAYIDERLRDFRRRDPIRRRSDSPL